MMYAVPVTLSPYDVTCDKWDYNGSADSPYRISASTRTLAEALPLSDPYERNAAAGGNDFRYRIYLTVVEPAGRTLLQGTYYIQDFVVSTVTLGRDSNQNYVLPLRREAIMAQRARR